MKINIVTSLNSSYEKFGKIFINSLYRNLNLNNINHIFILDVGLSESNKTWLSNYSKVIIIDMSNEIESEIEADINLNKSDLDVNIDNDIDKWRVWGNCWERSVQMKTLGFKKLLSQGNYPLVLIDSDCLFLKDFNDLLNDNYDLQVCRRNYRTPYIASFFVAYNLNCIEFIEDWIININKLKRMPKETTALNTTISLYKSLYKNPPKNKSKLLIKDIDENLISSLSYHSNARIIHMKGAGLDDFNTSFSKRTNGVVNLSSNIILEYLNGPFKNITK